MKLKTRQTYYRFPGVPVGKGFQETNLVVERIEYRFFVHIRLKAENTGDYQMEEL